MSKNQFNNEKIYFTYYVILINDRNFAKLTHQW